MGLFDTLFGGGGKDSAEEAAGLYDQVYAPNVEDMRLQLEEYVQQGLMSPEQARTYLVQNNATDDMNLDTVGKDAQLEALRGLTEIGKEGGMTATDKAKLQRIASDEQTQSRGAREAILNNAAARGAGGSGLEMLNQLTNAQESATRQSQRDLDVAGQARERALEAMQAAGTAGGQINQQQFAQEQAKANSKNEIAKFNAANQQTVGLANTAANNAAQTANLATKQNVANANVGANNAAQQYNKSLLQTNYDNQLKKTTAKANALGGVGAQANADRDKDAGLVGGAVDIGGKVLGSVFSDERVKKEVEPFDAGRFLDDLTGYRYKYKDPGMGEGEQVGVMAQDLEKEAPQMVEDTPRGKVVDYSPEKAGGPIMASLAHLHDRLSKLEGR